MLKTLTGLTIAAGLSLSAIPGLAYDKGDIILRSGFATVRPDDSSSNLNLSSTFDAALDAGELADTGASVDEGNALGITLTYMLTANIGIELLAATPFEHDIQADLSGLGLGVGTVDAGSTKHLPPTLSLQWYPMDSGSPLQPYLGVGLNYTTFFSEDVDVDLENAVGIAADVLLGGTGATPIPLQGKMELDNSWGLSAQLGVDYAINQNWVFNAAIWFIDIDTDATIRFDTTTNVEAAKVNADVDIDPWVYMVSLGYQF